MAAYWRMVTAHFISKTEERVVTSRVALACCARDLAALAAK